MYDAVSVACYAFLQLDTAAVNGEQPFAPLKREAVAALRREAVQNSVGCNISRFLSRDLMAVL